MFVAVRDLPDRGRAAMDARPDKASGMFHRFAIRFTLEGGASRVEPIDAGHR